MAVVVGADGRNDHSRHVGRGVLFFDDRQVFKVEKVGWELRAARRVLATKKFMRAIAVYALKKVGERRESGVASATIVESARAHEGELGAVVREFVDLAV